VGDRGSVHEDPRGTRAPAFTGELFLKSTKLDRLQRVELGVIETAPSHQMVSLTPVGGLIPIREESNEGGGIRKPQEFDVTLRLPFAGVTVINWTLFHQPEPVFIKHLQNPSCTRVGLSPESPEFFY